MELLFYNSALTVRLTLTVLLAKQHNYLSQRLVFIYFFVVIFSEVASLPFLLVLLYILYQRFTSLSIRHFNYSSLHPFSHSIGTSRCMPSIGHFFFFFPLLLFMFFAIFLLCLPFIQLLTFASLSNVPSPEIPFHPSLSELF